MMGCACQRGAVPRSLMTLKKVGAMGKMVNFEGKMVALDTLPNGCLYIRGAWYSSVDSLPKELKAQYSGLFQKAQAQAKRPKGQILMKKAVVGVPKGKTKTAEAKKPELKGVVKTQAAAKEVKPEIKGVSAFTQEKADTGAVDDKVKSKTENKDQK